MKQADAYKSGEIARKFSDLLRSMSRVDGFDGEVAMSFINLVPFVDGAPVWFIKRVFDQRLNDIEQQLAVDERRILKEKDMLT